MNLQKNTKRYAELSHGDVVYFLGHSLKVYAPAWKLDIARPDIHVAVSDSTGKISHIHFESLEVEVPEVPETPEVEWKPTNFYTDLSTGTLYFVSGSDFIAVNSISASIAASTVYGNPARYKRLYREV